MAVPPVARQPQQIKPKARGGGTAGSQFEQAHPRGRGGLWIVKHGDGYGAQGPSQTTAQLQQRLNQLGFRVPVDGKYGPATSTAVQEFQKRYGLDPKMGVDAATLEFLQNPPSQTIAQIQKEKATTTAKTSTSSAKTSSSTTSTTQSPATAKAVKDAKIAAIAAQAAAKEAHAAGSERNVKQARQDASDAQDSAKEARKIAQDAKTAAEIAKRAAQSGGKQAKADAAEATKNAKAAAAQAKSATQNAKGAIKAVKALKQQLAKERAARIKAAQAPLPGEVAVLARGPARSVSSGGGAKAKLTPPKSASVPKSPSGKVQVATSARQPTEPPDLEETLFFGFGGDVSHAILDGRDSIPTSDLPIWTRTGFTQRRDLTVPDGRDYTTTVTLLAEAILARRRARTGAEFTSALARERVLRARLGEAFWQESLHPRGRGGKWIDRLGLGGQKHGATMAADYFDMKQRHELVPTHRLAPSRMDTPEHVAKAARYMDRAKAGQIAKRKPLTVRREPDGTLRVLDGNSTLQVAKERGLTHVPIRQVHLEDLGERQLRKRLQPDSGATDEERQKVRAILQRRGAILSKLRAGSAGAYPTRA